MAVCMQCGAVYRDLDSQNHSCRPQDLPGENEMILPGGVRVPMGE